MTSSLTLNGNIDPSDKWLSHYETFEDDDCNTVSFRYYANQLTGAAGMNQSALGSLVNRNYSTIQDLERKWYAGKNCPKSLEHIRSKGFRLPVDVKSGNSTEVVYCSEFCFAVIQHYAIKDGYGSAAALSLETLGNGALVGFIYEKVGYTKQANPQDPDELAEFLAVRYLASRENVKRLEAENAMLLPKAQERDEFISKNGMNSFSAFCEKWSANYELTTTNKNGSTKKFNSNALHAILIDTGHIFNACRGSNASKKKAFTIKKEKWIAAGKDKNSQPKRPSYTYSYKTTTKGDETKWFEKVLTGSYTNDQGVEVNTYDLEITANGVFELKDYLVDMDYLTPINDQEDE